MEKLSLNTQNCHTINNKLRFIFFIGILSFRLSCGEELSENAEEYVDRDAILENIEIQESSGDGEETVGGELLSFWLL